MSFTKRIRDEISEKKFSDKSRAFVRDCFVAGGVISNPQKAYHLEFLLDDENADKISEILVGFGLRPKKILRGGQNVIYLKEAEEISDVLKIIRADKSLLALEELRVEKAIANNVNRKVNFETANLNKTVDAAQVRIESIKYIEKNGGLGILPEPLEEVARLRLQNESLSLAEIGELLNPPAGKSRVNHRLRKICEIARDMREQSEV
ncbi:MAG: DNA-binding protein WhiA [Defluviitaleaceae bacterium]|nr:DNA-binding protein WhiA [Defluviitaleaceae bacterium]